MITSSMARAYMAYVEILANRSIVTWKTRAYDVNDAKAQFYFECQQRKPPGAPATCRVTNILPWDGTEVDEDLSELE